MPRFISILAMLCVVGGSTFAAENTHDRLMRFGDEMAKLWTDFPLQRQDQVRQRASSDLNTAFSNDINNLDAPPNQSMAKVVQTYLASMKKAITLFRLAKMNSERTLYFSACNLTFRREIEKATDYAASRNTQQVFEMFAQYMEWDREALKSAPDALQQSISGFQQIFSQLVTSADPPKNSDPTKTMDKNVKEAQRRFPKELEINKNIYSFMEQAAAQVEQREFQAIKH